jgi:gluconokinase
MSTDRAGRVVIGLDVGTTGVKAAAFGLGSPWRAVAIREYPLLTPGSSQEVEDPVVVLEASVEALTECVHAAAGAEVIAVSVSAAMHGLLALDAGLRPLTPLITWADGRASREAAALHHQGVASWLHALTGTPVHPMTPMVKLLWFSSHDRATWQAARWWVGLKEWILLGFTGRLTSELSSASGTGLLDMSTRTWATGVLQLCGLDPDQLPPILPTTAVLNLTPETARRAGLPPDTPIVAGAGDGPLGNLGVGAIRAGIAGLSVGTSGAVRMPISLPQVDAEHSLFCYALTEGSWVLGGSLSNGGSTLRWAGPALIPDFRAATAGEVDDEVLRQAGSVPAGSDGLIMLPYLLPERAPLWDPDIPGAYLGLRHRHSRAHLLRAALEGVCLQMRLLVDQLEQVGPVEEVRATGGVFRSSLWRTTMAAMLGRAILVVGDAEGTALGAAALALFALGLASDLGVAVADLSGEDPGRAATIEPEPALVDTYDHLRASIPGLILGLSKVAGLVEGTAG